MRWSVYLIMLFLMLVIDASVGNVLALGAVRPLFLPILVVYVTLFAPRMTALWAAWIAGLLVDLLTDLPHGADHVGPLIGPHALGAVFGAYAILQIRVVLLRRHVLTVVAMTLLFVAASSMVTVFIYAAHGWYDSETLFWADIGPLAELWRRVLGALYTTAGALIVGPILVLTTAAWKFRGPSR